MQQTGTIGIIGGGQLGRMLTEAAIHLGFKVIVLDPGANSPASQVGADQIVKDYSYESLKALTSQVDFMTTEFEEGLDPEMLQKLADTGTRLNPAPHTIGLILDKLDQKNYLSQKDIPIGPYAELQNEEQAGELLNKYGGKMVIKTRRGGYDGYGNRLVSNASEVRQALADFQDKAVYAEAFVPFVKELAVMVGRSVDGQIVTYPVVETIQKNNICHEVLAPAQLDESIQQKAMAMAQKVAGQFEGAGMFGVEMFLTDNGEVILNEIAPRVHNSGHYTIEACETSQFEQHIRAVTGMPLGSTEMKVPAAVMINILGERDGPTEIKGLEEAEAIPGTKVHLYGKNPTKTGRKMGHITSVGANLAEAREHAAEARRLISI